jgi:hypothetical protein
VYTFYFRNYFYNHRNILNSITRDLHGVKNNFLFSEKNLPAVSLISLLNCCLTARFVEKCKLFNPIYLKIHYASSVSNNSENTTVGARFAGPTGTRNCFLVPCTSLKRTHYMEHVFTAQFDWILAYSCIQFFFSGEKKEKKPLIKRFAHLF